MDIEGISKCDKYSYTQVGTAQRAHDLFKDEIRWCSDTDNWYVFDKITRTHSPSICRIWYGNDFHPEPFPFLLTQGRLGQGPSVRTSSRRNR